MKGQRVPTSVMFAAALGLLLAAFAAGAITTNDPAPAPVTTTVTTTTTTPVAPCDHPDCPPMPSLDY